MYVHNRQQTNEATTTETLSSPIAMLPPELVRDIVFFAVGDPRERHTILRLSQVSQSLRQTVLDMSWLFTEADWNCWPTPLLDLWCRRACAQPLTVYLTAISIYRLMDGEAPELQALLESCSRRWGTLIFATTSQERCTRFVERLLQRACPLLHTISGQGALGPRTTLHLHPDCVPSLQTLYFDRIWPIFSTSFTSVTELTCTCARPTDWSPFLEVLKGCHLVQRLTINSWGYYRDDPIVFPAATGKAVLSSLTHLEIGGMNARLVPAIGQFLGHCDIPKLKSLDIPNLWSTGPESFESLYQSVVRR